MDSTELERVAPLDVPLSPGAVQALCATMELDRRLADLKTADRALLEATAVGRVDLAMRARLAMADAMARAGDLSAADQVIAEVLDWATEAAEDFIVARSHFLLSIVDELRGDIAAATHHACLAVDRLPEGVPAGVRARHLVTLALSLDQMRKGDGLPYYTEALDIAAATGDPRLALSVLSNLVFNELETPDVEAAWALVTKMWHLAERTGTALRAADLENIALVEIARGEYAAAERTLQPLLAIPCAAALTEAKSLPCGLLVLAQAQRHQGHVEDAQRTLDRCRQLCDAAGLTGTALRVSEEQAQLYAAAGRFEEAYQEHRHLYAASRALLSAEREAEAMLTQTAFEEREGRRENGRYREMALRDALTGLYNQRFIDHQLPALVERCRLDNRPLSVAIVDADYFKRVNDTFSHDVGDVVLQRLAGILADGVDEPATVARLGGEEFLLVMPDTGARTALETADRLRLSIQAHAWSPLTGQLCVTVSIGVTTTVDGLTTQAALLQRADRNLYAAKRSGRNRVIGDPGSGEAGG